MTIAIIGGAGFIGTRLSKRLDNSKIDFNVYDKNISSSQNIIYADVVNSNSLEQLKGNDTIINLAAEHRDDVEPKSKYDDVNVQGAMNICNAARKFSINKINRLFHIWFCFLHLVDFCFWLYLTGFFASF